MQGKIIIVSAPSGAGKTTIVKHLLSLEHFKLEFSVSATSRQKRKNEIHGVDYYFLNEEEFRKKIANNEFLEWEEVYKKQYYGTLKNEVTRIWKKGKHVIFDVDVMGGLNIKKQFESNSLALFVQPPAVTELEKRLRNRSSESEEQISKRLAKAKEELSYANKFDIILINDNLNEALITAEQLVGSFLMH